jgi:sulfotransferase
MKHYYFLSGIARSGSTLLGSILNQNPEIYVSPTSPLLDLYCTTEESLQKLNMQYTFDLSKISPAIHSSLHTSFYSNVKQKYVIDKHRGWPRNINTIKQIITPNPKVICTHRPIVENIVSFLKLANKDPNNFIDKDLVSKGIPLTTRNRAMATWENFSADPFYSFKQGLDYNRKHMHIVKYDDLVSNPKQELEKVYNFLEIDFYKGHYFSNISNTCAENDSNWGMKNLHTIHPELKKTSDDPFEVLGEELVEFFAKIEKQLNM